MYKKLVVLAAIFLVVFFAGCQQPAPKAPTEEKAKEKTGTIYLGAPISLSGKFSKEGQMSLWGMQTAIKWVNEKHGGIKVGDTVYKLELKYYDDESKKETVQSLVERLATVDKVKFILAPYSSGLTLAAAEYIFGCNLLATALL